MPALKDIKVVKGDTLVVPLTFSTMVNPTTKAPIDLTNSEMLFEAFFSDTDLTISSEDVANTHGSFLVTDAALGKAELVINYQETEAWPGGGVRYRISRIVGDRKRTFMRGALKIDGWPHA